MFPSVDKLNPNLQWIGENDITDIWTYLQSIDWSEGWLIGLVSFHLLCFVVIVFSKRHSYFQYGLFLILLVSVMAGERINKIAAENWKLFSKQQYFDSNGLFISTVFSGPIILNCVVILILWLLDAYTLLIKVKRREVIANIKSNQSADENTDTKLKEE